MEQPPQIIEEEEKNNNKNCQDEQQLTRTEEINEDSIMNDEKENDKEENNINDLLPDEILLTIFESGLDPRKYGKNISLVCKRWNLLCKDTQLWGNYYFQYISSSNQYATNYMSKFKSVYESLLIIHEVYDKLLISARFGYDRIFNEILYKHSPKLAILFSKQQNILQIAAEKGNYYIIKSVISYIKQREINALCRYVNLKDIHGRSPLHSACMKGHFDIVKLLVENGHIINFNIQLNAPPNLHLNPPNPNLLTPVNNNNNHPLAPIPVLEYSFSLSFLFFSFPSSFFYFLFSLRFLSLSYFSGCFIWENMSCRGLSPSSFSLFWFPPLFLLSSPLIPSSSHLPHSSYPFHCMNMIG